ncbi:GDSL-type esterase/lipase family protein [Actinomadura gamaensis]|uniref:GDSL-type esterase/lipase family protein n=1 Tax=Actinomadura gamaensis TaxID=1763541 RepID=A0ABV9U996_9ACTN
MGDTNRYVLHDGVVTVEGALGLERGPGWVRPWRLPPEDLDLHHPDLVVRAANPSGVRLRWRTSATRVAVEVEPVVVGGEQVDELRYDLFVDGGPHSSLVTGMDARVVAFEGLPSGPKDLELWLPHRPALKIGTVTAPDGTIEPPAPDDRPRWVVYGSSITHGMTAGPAGTWPAVAARLLGRHLTSLGFGGQCHLDPLVARAIAGLPADHITLKLGINVHNRASMRERAFLPAVHGFLATLRERRPDVPITVVSPILSPERETSTRTVREEDDGTIVEAHGDLTLEAIRDVLAEAVRVRRARGDRHLTYLDGRELFGRDDLAHLPDGLHPDAEGLRRMGERYAALARAAG